MNPHAPSNYEQKRLCMFTRAIESPPPQKQNLHELVQVIAINTRPGRHQFKVGENESSGVAGQSPLPLDLFGGKIMN